MKTNRADPVIPDTLNSENSLIPRIVVQTKSTTFSNKFDLKRSPVAPISGISKSHKSAVSTIPDNTSASPNISNYSRDNAGISVSFSNILTPKPLTDNIYMKMYHATFETTGQSDQLNQSVGSVKSVCLRFRLKTYPNRQQTATNSGKLWQIPGIFGRF